MWCYPWISSVQVLLYILSEHKEGTTKEKEKNVEMKYLYEFCLVLAGRRFLYEFNGFNMPNQNSDNDSTKKSFKKCFVYINTVCACAVIIKCY